MESQPIRFDDGAAYERFMGAWSHLVGEIFLDWLNPPSGGRWLDVGCGNGAFTETLLTRCAPSLLAGIDPSEAQLAFARQRPVLQSVAFQQGDAMALPYADDSFDAAVMPLVIFFVPEPLRGVAEMGRVVGPGGLVAAYAWDMAGGGFPYQAVRDELQTLGATFSRAPSEDASRLEAMAELWAAAGLEGLESRAITVERSFADFDDYWDTLLGGPSVGATLAALQPGAIAELQERLRQRLPKDSAGRITYAARAHAIRGVVPARPG